MRVLKSIIPALVCLFMLIFFWFVPKLEVHYYKDKLTPKELIQAESDSRKTWSQGFGILGGILLLFFTWRRIEVAKEGQITDRFTKAIDQLGAKDQNGQKANDVRLGGIYALERIAKDSKKDYWTIIEVLTTYVRENSPRTTETEEESELITFQDGTIWYEDPAPADIQAILTVLGRRKGIYKKDEDNYIDLNHSNLQKIVVPNANLEGAYLWGVNLHRARLWKCNLKGARIMESNLTNAFLIEANLEKALLVRANLSNAELRNANLRDAGFLEANLEGCHLESADLRGALRLTIEQLSEVKTLYKAKIDPELMKEIKENCPELLEKPK